MLDHGRFARDHSHPPAVVLGDLTMIRSLALGGIPSIVVTADPRDVALHSRFVTGSSIVPGFDPPRAMVTLDRLLELGQSLYAAFARKVPLFYGSDAHLAFLYTHKGRLGDYFTMLLNDSVGPALLDKERFSALAERHGFPVPRIVPLAEAKGPVLVKPKRKVAWEPLRRALFGASKARVFETRNELLRAKLGALEADLVVQEYIPADTRDLSSFHAFANARGELLGSFSGRKLRTYPKSAGESSFIELTDDWEVAKLGAEVAGKLGLVGPFKIDMIRDQRNGALYVLEVNARFTLWSYLGAVHGVNLPQIAYEHFTGGPVPPVRRRSPRVRWLNLYRDYKSFKEHKKMGELGLFSWGRSLLTRPKVYETFAWNDPAPFAWWAIDFAQGRGSRGHPLTALGGHEWHASV
jgi:predicted ATP-grasp superfamily ATP-dependent carboligase